MQKTRGKGVRWCDLSKQDRSEQRGGLLVFVLQERGTAKGQRVKGEAICQTYKKGERYDVSAYK